jgi:flagellar biosynthesis/type III secretory pathway protein FliH
MTHKLIKTDDYLLVVDDSEIQKGDCYLSPSGIWFYNHLNPNHNKESKKVCAHLPLNGSPILEGVDLLPPIEDEVEEAERAFTEVLDSETKQVYDKMILDATEHGFIIGYNKAREKYKYTEEDVIRLIEKSRETGLTAEYLMLSSQYPTEFECEMESVRQPPPSRGFNVVPITVISAHGVEWVGEYK